jgi:hypothetical protein
VTLGRRRDRKARVGIHAPWNHQFRGIAAARALTILLTLGNAGCDARETEAKHSASAVVDRHSPATAGATSVATAATDSSPLTLASLPNSARSELLSELPGFVPFDPSQYPASVVARTHRSHDEGVVVIRADIQGEGRVDYAVAGMDGDSLRVIALFARVDGSYKPVRVFAERFSPWARFTPPGVPALVLERAPCRFQCAKMSTYAIVPHYVGDQTGHPTHLVWVPTRHAFFSDTDEHID